MTSLSASVLKAFFEPLGTLLVALSPMVGIGWYILHERKKYRAKANEPFTQLPLRPAGESLRLKIEALTDEYEGTVFGLALTGVLAAGLFWRLALNTTSLVAILIFAVGGYAYFSRKLLALARELWKYRLAYTGERVVGEELNQLLASGFRVFHDVPFDNFNIDHVLVGPVGGVDFGPRQFAALHGQQSFAMLFDSHRDAALAEGRCTGDQQPNEVHGVFPTHLALRTIV